MAVRKLYRGQNLGSKIMLAAENGIRRDGFNTCSLSAQVQAKTILRSLLVIRQKGKNTLMKVVHM